MKVVVSGGEVNRYLLSERLVDPLPSVDLAQAPSG
jgi:hypothetical protein